MFLTLLILASGTLSARSRERFSGTVLSYGSGAITRTVMTNFTLNITGYTSDEDARNYLGILKDNGQDKVLDAVDGKELGRFSGGANVGVPVNVIRESDIDGKRRIFVVFRRGGRSLPNSVTVTARPITRSA
ncbi:MAG: hypothetical protein ABIP06_06715 [Pyrinomonadaceae bacterium]